MAKGKKVNDHRVRRRKRLIRWAEVMEALSTFEDVFNAACDDGTLDDVTAGNAESALRCLRSELFSGVPDQW